MPSITKIDKVNKVGGRVAIPYERFFGEMPITEKQKKEREEAAEDFELDMLFLFALLAYEHDRAVLVREFQRRYRETARKHGGNDEAMDDYANKVSVEIVDTTLRHEDEEFWTSEDRAIIVAENEANTVRNYADWMKAKEEGKTTKTWLTMLDDRVRSDHVMAEGQRVPIDEPFVVGGDFMMYPRDRSLGASEEQIAGCRCHMRFS